MKKFSTFIFSALISTCIFSQTWGTMYRVQLKDKNNSPYNINNPSDFLTQRAIDRRTKQNIAIDETDIPVNQSYISELTNNGAVVVNKSRWFNTATIFLSDSSKLTNIRELPFVTQITKVKPYFQQTVNEDEGGNEYIFSDNNIANSYAVKKSINYGKGFNQANMIGVDYLHELGYCGQGMVIAVIDAGFYNVDKMEIFDSLNISGRLLGTKDFVEIGGDVFRKATHGMSVLSTMCGNIPGEFVGTAPRASYWLLRSEDGASEYVVEECNWVAAAEFADSVGADIINSSLGYTSFDDPSQGHFYSELDGNTAFITKGADMAAAKGILVVNSAGNSGNSQWRHIGVPADADNILTIGAVTSNGNYAAFSSQGPTADGRIKPTVTAQGQGTYVSDMNGKMRTGNGTSFSSPVTAGAVACLWQANPTATNMDIINAVCKSANKYNKPDNLYGYGIPNMAVAHLIINGTDLTDSQDNDFILANPNPFTEDIHLIFHSTAQQSITIQLTNQNGKKIWDNNKYLAKEGYNYIFIPKLKSLSQGVYILNCITSKDKISQKIVKR